MPVSRPSFLHAYAASATSGALLVATLLGSVFSTGSSAASFLEGSPVGHHEMLAQSANRTHPSWPSQVPVDRRIIPKHARLGMMGPPRNGRVKMDDKTMLLAPGLRIRDHNNRIVQPSTLHEKVAVRYTVDQYQQLLRVWISPFERVPSPAPLPERRQE